MKRNMLGRTLGLLELVWCLAAGVSVALGTTALILDFFKKDKN